MIHMTDKQGDTLHEFRKMLDDATPQQLDELHAIARESSHDPAVKYSERLTWKIVKEAIRRAIK